MFSGVDGATESVAPDPNEYPEYFSDSFADTVGVDLVDLTPPMPNFGNGGTGNGASESDEDLHGLGAPFANGDPAMLPPLGSLPNSLDSVLAYPLDDFFASPFNTFKTVPKDFMESYATAMSRIMKHLGDALESDGVDRERRLALAIRWYAAAPQLFFRNPRTSVERNVNVLRVHFRQFLRGDYALFLEEWRRDYDKSLARER